MAKFRVSINRSACISDAICTAVSGNWYMDSDGKASYHREIIDDSEYGENHEAEISCPMSIIKIEKVS